MKIQNQNDVSMSKKRGQSKLSEEEKLVNKVRRVEKGEG